MLVVDVGPGMRDNRDHVKHALFGLAVSKVGPAWTAWGAWGAAWGGCHCCADVPMECCAECFIFAAWR